MPDGQSPKRLRVLLVSHHALPHVGGVEVLIDKEIRALCAAGHRVVLLTSDAGGSGQTPSYPDAVEVLRLPAWYFLERRFQLPYPIFGPALLRALWREVGRCDVVHAHGFIFLNSALALVIAWLRGRPRILTDHGGIQHFRSRLIAVLARCGIETVGRLSACLATRLVSYNTRIGGLLERLARTRRKSLFLPNPIDYRLFHPPSAEERRRARTHLGWPADRAKVLFVGRLIPEKGVPLLLRAADPAFDLVFCGPGDQALLGPLPRLGVEYLPPRPQRELVAVYQAADLLVAPSDQREGFPVVVQEALACGLRVITSYEEGYAPYRHLPGLSFCEREPAALRAAIQQALSEPCVSSSLARQAALEEFCPPEDQWVARLYGDLRLYSSQASFPFCPPGASRARNAS
jgi:glycosyltransferase involved in cell wall biosynthesis